MNRIDALEQITFGLKRKWTDKRQKDVEGICKFGVQAQVWAYYTFSER